MPWLVNLASLLCDVDRWLSGRVLALHSVVASLISSGGDHSIHCWWDLIRSKQLPSGSICHMQVFARFSGHGNSIYIIFFIIKVTEQVFIWSFLSFTNPLKDYYFVIYCLLRIIIEFFFFLSFFFYINSENFSVLNLLWAAQHFCCQWYTGKATFFLLLNVQHFPIGCS